MFVTKIKENYHLACYYDEESTDDIVTLHLFLAIVNNATPHNLKKIIEIYDNKNNFGNVNYNKLLVEICYNSYEGSPVGRDYLNLLMEKGININQIGIGDISAAQFACYSKNYDMLEDLIMNGVDIFHRDNKDRNLNNFLESNIQKLTEEAIDAIFFENEELNYMDSDADVDVNDLNKPDSFSDEESNSSSDDTETTGNGDGDSYGDKMLNEIEKAELEKINYIQKILFKKEHEFINSYKNLESKYKALTTIVENKRGGKIRI
jgi:hypothetical protein